MTKNRFLLSFLLLGGSTSQVCASWSDFFDFAVLAHPKYSVERNLGFDDFAESPPEFCPATTTCYAVCVANASDCPTQCEGGEELCNDGTCKPACLGDEATLCGEDAERCNDMPVTCKREIDFYDACKEKYAPFYDKETACIDAQIEATPLLSFTDPAFLFCYLWISGVSLLTFLWCLFNQKIFPVQGSTVAMGEQGWSQTGYKRHWIGIIIHGFVMLTLWGIQFLLLMLTIFYYMQQGAVTRWEPVFEDEVQVLVAFEVVWFVGLIWSFVFRWPLSVQSLFLRRCTLDQAAFVAVVSRQKQVEIIEDSKIGENLVNSIVTPVNFIFYFLFSYPFIPSGYAITYCEVAVDRMTGTRRFFHHMCRYVYDKEAAMYVTGSMDVGTTMGDFLKQSNGLTSDEALQRLHTVGHNMIPMAKPTILGNIFKEFSKTFYLYQNFMVWTWAPYWYYYMAITHSIVRVTGGVVVGVFQYMSDSVLYQISHVEGTVNVLRDGNSIPISVTDLVPGDVVVLERGPVFCDMVIVKAEHLVVDESALTGEATPIVKAPIEASMQGEKYDVKYHKIHTDQFVFAFFYGIFVLGTVIPPLLPTVFVVSVGISAHRLRSRQITCTYPEGILIAGKVNATFFDKTGTLTEVGMSFVGMKSEDAMTGQVKTGMAVCHGLKLSTDGEMLGNHVDQASFRSTGAELQFTQGENVSVVTTAVELGLKTLMCGDGQNDCGALKSAHVGVALSSSEASVVAPFTSLEKSVTSVVDVLREGRCALSSAFKVYSFYIIYGQLESYLQTIAAYLFVSFTEWCWVFLDGFWPMLMAFSLPLASAAPVLSPYRPTASLLGPRTMFSVCGLLAWNFFFLTMAFVALNNEDWYQCRKWSSEDVSNVLTIGDNYETSVLFMVGGYQYISSAIALNFGYTFRAPWYKNYIFVALAALFTTFQFVATLHPSSFSCIWRLNCDNDDAVRWVTSLAAQPINNPFNTTVMPVRFRWILAGIMFINLVTLCVWEYFFVNRLLFKLFDFKKGSSEEPIIKLEGAVVM